MKEWQITGPLQYCPLKMNQFPAEVIGKISEIIGEIGFGCDQFSFQMKEMEDMWAIKSRREITNLASHEGTKGLSEIINLPSK